MVSSHKNGPTLQDEACADDNYPWYLRQEEICSDGAAIAPELEGRKATAYLDLGLSPIEILPRDKRPNGPWKDRQKTPHDAATCKSIDASNSGVGIVAGKVSGILVIDIDGEAGYQSLAMLESICGHIPITACAATKRGIHIYLKIPDGYDIPTMHGHTANGLEIPGIDICCEKSYLIAPPSTHPEGHQYYWHTSPWEYGFAELPDAWLKVVVKDESTQNAAVLDFNDAADLCDDAGITEYTADGIQTILADQIAHVAAAPDGERNVTLNKAAYIGGGLVHAGVDEHAYKNQLLSVARQVKLNDAEAKATIESGISSGKQNPLSPKDHISSSKNSNSSNGSSTTIVASDEWPALIPLDQDMAPSEDYPLDALPPIIRDAVINQQAYGQQPIPLVAMAALANVSLACQALANVARDKKLVGPISLSFILAAESGERKSSADRVFSNATRQREQELIAETLETIKRKKSEYAAYLAEHNGIKQEITRLAKNKGKNEDKLNELRELIVTLDENAPIVPMKPTLLYEDATSESLVLGICAAWPSAALYSDEAAIVIGSHGFNPDNCLRYFGFLNRLWDGAAYSRLRVTQEDAVFKSRRLTCSLMLQPSVLKTLVNIGDGQSRNTGFLARILLAYPESTIGTRFYLPPPENDPALQAFEQRMWEMLKRDIPLDDQGEVTPPTLSLSKAAHKLWVDYYNSVEASISKHAELFPVKDFAAKSAENAARLAANFHLFSGGELTEINANTMQSGIRVARWHLHETLRIFEQMDETIELRAAKMVITWLKDQQFKGKKHDTITPSELARFGPNPWRKLHLSTRKAALQLLCTHQYLRPKLDGKKENYAINPAIYADDGGAL